VPTTQQVTKHWAITYQLNVRMMVLTFRFVRYPPSTACR
jgi:hypothetical protein